MTLRYHTPLTPDEQRAAGLTAPRVLAMADRVRYGELDTLNHVNNKAYFGWFETLRVEYSNRFCQSFYDTPPRLVLRSAEVRFLRELVAGEDYIATAHVTGFRRTSYMMEQQIWSGDLRATLHCIMVALSPDGTARLPLPADLTDAFRTRDRATPDT